MDFSKKTFEEIHNNSAYMVICIKAKKNINNISIVYKYYVRAHV